MRALTGIVLAALLACAPAFAAAPALIAAAKKEGRLVWYTTQIVDQFAQPAADAFQKKYGIKVSITRTNSSTAAVRILNENRAGKNQSDVFDGTITTVPLKKAGYVLKWLPDAAKDYPPLYKDPEGYWIATNIYVLTPAYNTRLVKPGTEPRTLADLLDPKWKGRMAWGDSLSSSAGIGFVGTVLAEMGEKKARAYFAQLAKQRIAALPVSARQVLDQTIAGEYAIALQIFNHHAVISAKEGAPVKWIPMEPATGVLSVVSIPKAAPHPNAAKLFVDFLVSKDGQTLFQKADYLPADPAVRASDPSLRPEDGHFHSRFFSPEQTAALMPTWKKVFDEFFR